VGRTLAYGPGHDPAGDTRSASRSPTASKKSSGATETRDLCPHGFRTEIGELGYRRTTVGKIEAAGGLSANCP
jgi:hypothetical protein